MMGRGASAASRHTQQLQRGFTVVETLIVLAMAGLILLIVLEAVPALERSSRNNQRRQDVQSVLASVSHWELNNSGNVPFSGNETNALISNSTKLSYYDTSNINFPPSGSAPGWSPSPNPDTDLDKLYVYNYQKCDSDPSRQGMSTAVGAGYSNVVALYAIETASGTASECEQL